MYKEQAESYVQYGINTIKMSKKLCTALLPVNLLFLCLSVALFHKLFFVIFIVCIALINIVSSIILKVKWSICSGFISQATQGLLLAISFDCIYFSMYKLANLFIWYEFLSSIATQIIAIALCIPIVVKNANMHNTNKVAMPSIIAGSVSGVACVGTTIFCKLFLTNASLSLVLTIISILMNVVVYILAYIIVTGYYRAYLIKKYKMKFLLI